MTRTFLLACLLAATAHTATAADRLAGAAMPMQSTGQPAADDAWRLDRNGYVAAYLVLDRPGPVVVSVNAQGVAVDGRRPALGVSVFGRRGTHEVSTQATAYRAGFDLPAGTHFLRIDLHNDPIDDPLSLTVHDVSVDRGDLAERATDDLALAAAQTWIDHGRQGPIVAEVPGLEPGQQVRVRLLRHERFDLGANVPGVANVWLANDQTPDGELTTFARKFLDCFTATVPSNAGKWAYNEPTRDVTTMAYPDLITDFAEAHNLRMRMHALVWDTEQQPDWVHDLLSRAKDGEADAAAELRREISERIDYYVRDRSARFHDIDVLNESFHQPGYLDLYGAEGVADIFREVASAVRSAGSEARLFVNEYNVLQWSRRPPYKGPENENDLYANWYREHVEHLRHLGAPVTGIGVQYYADARTELGEHTHSPARIQRVFENLAVTGLPVSLTEFGIAKGASPRRAAQILSETMQVLFGHPSADLFLMFGFYRPGTWERAREACLYDEDWQLTEPGKAFHELKDEWFTDTSTQVMPDGGIRFDGFYGEYEAIVDGRAYPFEAHAP